MYLKTVLKIKQDILELIMKRGKILGVFRVVLIKSYTKYYSEFLKLDKFIRSGWIQFAN